MSDRHLDDEQLSDLLDGGSGDRAHLASCASCAARLDGLRAARDAVAAAAVPPLAPGLLDELVATALADDAAPVADPDPAIVPISRGRRRVPPPAWLLGVAAALLALVGVAGVLRSVGGSDGRDSMALTARDQGDDADASSAGAEKSAATGAGATVAADAAAAPIDPEAVSFDLADQQDPSELAVLLRDRTANTTRLAAGAATAASGGSGSAPTTSAPPAPQAAAVDRAQCRARAEAEAGDAVGALLSTGTVRWKGQPAEVLVFELRSPEEGVTRQAMVLQRPGCSLLAEQRF